MRNFGNDYLFVKQFYLGAKSNWLITTQSHLLKNQLQLYLKFKGLDNLPVGIREMQFKVLNGNKLLQKNNAQTLVDGTLNFNFDIANDIKPKNIHVIASDLRDRGNNQKYDIPVLLNCPEQTDLQFMPEGGSLIAGLPAYIGFKAIDENGKGTNVYGDIYDQKNHKIISFRSEHQGMGSFRFTPQANNTYNAKLILPDGRSIIYPLPQVQVSGTGLQIDNLRKTDSLTLTINATPDILQKSQTYFILGHARGVVCYAGAITLQKGINITISTKNFPSGIAHFVLFNSINEPVNERVVYIDHNDGLKIGIHPDKLKYDTRERITLNIQVNDKDGQPVQGSFSLAVTDDSQVKIDSLAQTTIDTYLLLTSDLKGEVEEPGYYLSHTPVAARHRDNLLLTQGWIGYDWKNMLAKPEAPLYAAELGFEIKGEITNLLNKPVAGADVSLFSKSPLSVLDTTTNTDGRFVFKKIIPSDSTTILITAKNKKGKDFNVGVYIDEFHPPVFKPYHTSIIPWYINPDSTYTNYLKKNTIRQVEREIIQANKHALKEVVITAKKIVPGSKNLNGPGAADLVLNKEDMQKAGKTTLRDLLLKNIRGFQRGMFRPKVGASKISSYLVGDKEARFIFDGVDLDKVATPTGIMYSRYDFITNILNTYIAEDILGVELMNNWHYNSRYSLNFLTRDQRILQDSEGLMKIDWAFIEITTRQGNGPFLHPNGSNYFYKPMAFSWPKQFYQPKYITKAKANNNPDLRSTIFWEPDVVTNKNGEAKLTFYAADTPGTYTLVLQGSDMAGNSGSTRRKITIAKKQ